MKHNLARLNNDPIYFARHMLGFEINKFQASVVGAMLKNRTAILHFGRTQGRITSQQVFLKMKGARDMNHWSEAETLMEDYPEQTYGYTLLEVMVRWEERSQLFKSDWLEPTEDDVTHVFGSWGKSN